MRQPAEIFCEALVICLPRLANLDPSPVGNKWSNTKIVRLFFV